jgi:hypothetical protein
MPTYVYIHRERKFVFLGRQMIVGSRRVLFQQTCPSMYVYNKKKARPGEAERDAEQGRQNKTSEQDERMGQAELDRHNGTGRTRYPDQDRAEHDIRIETGRTGQAEWYKQTRISRVVGKVTFAPLQSHITSYFL